MGFKMKGNPAKKGAIEGTSSYESRKEALLNKGFTQKDADQMIKDGGDFAGNVTSAQKAQAASDWEPAYPGADYSKDEIAKMPKKPKKPTRPKPLKPKKKESPAKQNTHAYEVDGEYYTTREEAEQARKKLKSKKEKVPSKTKQKHSYTKKAGTNVTGKYTNFAQGVPMYGKYTPEKFVLGETKPKPSIYDHYNEDKSTTKSPAKQSWSSQKSKMGSTHTTFGGQISLNDARKSAKKGGFKTFTWKGKKYNTAAPNAHVKITKKIDKKTTNKK
tara:strand:- start:183 stop:1001 length:819 start_codon:yes stop_codon:yes gene_type:complete